MPAKTKQRPIIKDELDPLIDKGVTLAFEKLRSRDTVPYDGVLGRLPDWIPKNVSRAFVQTRNRLLDAGYQAKQVSDFIDEDIADCRSALANHHKAISTFPFVLPLKVRNDVRMLAHIRTGEQLGPVKGLAFLTDERHARKVAIAQKYSEQQSINASRKRGDKSDVHKIIRVLALDRDGEGAKALWDAFIGHLRDNCLDPDVNTNTSDHKKWKVTYDHVYSGAARGSRVGRKTMTFGQFANLLSHYRQKKKSG